MPYYRAILYKYYFHSISIETRNSIPRLTSYIAILLKSLGISHPTYIIVFHSLYSFKTNFKSD